MCCGFSLFERTVQSESRQYILHLVVSTCNMFELLCRDWFWKAPYSVFSFLLEWFIVLRIKLTITWSPSFFTTELNFPASFVFVYNAKSYLFRQRMHHLEHSSKCSVDLKCVFPQMHGKANNANSLKKSFEWRRIQWRNGTPYQS